MYFLQTKNIYIPYDTLLLQSGWLSEKQTRQNRQRDPFVHDQVTKQRCHLSNHNLFQWIASGEIS